MPKAIQAAVWFTCSIVTCAGILFVYCFMTNSWSILAPHPKHAPAIEFCYEGQFGNDCGWE